MKKRRNRTLAILLASAMVIGMTPVSVSAEDIDITTQEESANQKADLEAEENNIPKTDLETEETEVPEEMLEEPEMQAVSEELEEIKIQSEDNGETVLLTEDQKQNLIQLYAQYKQFLVENADYFGVRSPFFSTRDTDKSPLGSMLILMGKTQEQVDSGEVTYEELEETIKVFMLGNSIAKDLYGEELLKIKDEALAELKDGMSDIDKLLVLNDWLAEHTSFDMAYIESREGNISVSAEGADEPYKTELKTVLRQTLESQGAAQDELDAYVEQLAPVIIGLWKGNQFGALVMQNAVCLGYSSAYAYLVQWAYPEIYQNEDGTWKSETEVNYIREEVPKVDSEGKVVIGEDGKEETVTNYTWRPDAPNMIDYVRIVFSSEHYWNAVKVNGTWYYIDPCYSDIYIECVKRDRVETAGNMNHLYFMISDTSVRELYPDDVSELITAYDQCATDQTYENAWFAYAKSPVDYDQETDRQYYVYDSTDMLHIKRSESTEAQGSPEDTQYQLVYHDSSEDDSSKWVTLVDFNQGQVLKDGVMTDNTLIQELFAKHKIYQEDYPSIAISGSVYQGKFYFNLANCILSYDLVTGEVVRVKEYNEVRAKRDSSVVIGNQIFTMASEEDTEGVQVIENPPIASMTIKNDGVMYVSVGTNFAYTSGKSSMDDLDSPGYEFEETDYNPYYGTVYGNTVNDNKEFLWCADVVDTLDMSHVTAGEHTWESVAVAPACEEEGYSEERCKTCGIVNPSGEKKEKVAAVGHHYIKFEQEYHTKDHWGNYNTGTAYVCVSCKDSQQSGVEASNHDFSEAEFIWADDLESAQAKARCKICGDKALDCLVGNQDIERTADAVIEQVLPENFNCQDGGTITYTATAVLGEQEVTDTKTQEIAKGSPHSYKQSASPKWSEDYQTCTFSMECTFCGHTEDETVEAKEDTDKRIEPTCTTDGTEVYTAVLVTDEQTFNASKERTLEKTGHSYGNPTFKWTEDNQTCRAIFICEKRDDTQTVICDVNITDRQEATCTEPGSITYTASCEFEGKTYSSDTIQEEIPAFGHDYKVSGTWSDDRESCDITLACKNEGCSTGLVIRKAELIEITENEAATCTEKGQVTHKATITYEGKTYSDTITDPIESLGHVYGEPVFQWASDHQSCSAVFTCEREHSHQKTVECTIDSEKSGGKIIYTAACTLDGNSYTDKRTVDAEITLPFKDVNKGDWFYEYVAYVYENKLMTGLDTDIFGPGVTLRRAHFATILYRMEGSPEVSYANVFPDVSQGQFYTDAAIWANENKIITGYSNGMFGPGDELTREQMATIMYRYSQYKGYDTSQSAELTNFPDGNYVSEFAKPAMKWAVGSGIISGTGTGDVKSLAPQGVSVRAECAAVIQRFKESAE